MPRRCASSTSRSREPRGPGAAGAVAAGGQRLLPVSPRRCSGRRRTSSPSRSSTVRDAGRDPPAAGASRDPRGVGRAPAGAIERGGRGGGACPGGRARGRDPAAPRASAPPRSIWLARRSFAWISAGRQDVPWWSRAGGSARRETGGRCGGDGALDRALADPMVARARRSPGSRATCPSRSRSPAASGGPPRPGLRRVGRAGRPAGRARCAGPDRLAQLASRRRAARLRRLATLGTGASRGAVRPCTRPRADRPIGFRLRGRQLRNVRRNLARLGPAAGSRTRRPCAQTAPRRRARRAIGAALRRPRTWSVAAPEASGCPRRSGRAGAPRSRDGCGQPTAVRAERRAWPAPDAVLERDGSSASTVSGAGSVAQR